MKKYIFLTALLLSSCKYSEKPKHFTSTQINVDYPSYLSKTDKVYPGAYFQVSNIYRDVYFIAQTYEPTTDTLKIIILQDSLVGLAKKIIREPLVESQNNYTNKKGYFVSETVFTGTIDYGDESKRLRYVFSTMLNKTKVLHTAGWFFQSKKDNWEKDIRFINDNITIN